MAIIKKFIKKSLRVFYKYKIDNHHIKKPSIDDDSFSRLNNLYQMQEYDLDNVIIDVANNDYDLSIIVPVYNSEKYIKECIDSLLNQDTKYNYEIICVDDGSTDSSLNILNNYNDERLKVFHKKNGGISSSRNFGLKKARGKYIGFVDNDDYVSNRYIDILLNKAIDNNLDYIKCSYEVVDNDKNCLERKIYSDSIIYDLNDVSNYQMWLHGYMWGGIYLRKIWKDFCFPQGYWYEDMVRNLYLYDCINSMACISDVIYFKRKHDNNAADVLWKKQDLKCLDQLYLAKQLIELKNKRNIKSNLISKYALVLELCEYLYKRLEGLDYDIQKDSFNVAANIIKDNQIDTNDINDKILRKAFIAFNNNDFELYQLIGKYYRYK